MKNRVIYRTKAGREWAEVSLVGQRPLVAKVDASDVAALGEYRWGWHPRGVFDHREGVLLTHVLFPDAREIFFQNRNRLDCRRENLVSGFRRPAPSGAKGVYYNPARAAFIAHCKRRGVQVCGYFPVADFPDMGAARRAAELQRVAFLNMSFEDLVRYKAGREPLEEREVWLGDDVAPAIAARVNYNPLEAARTAFRAGLMASRVIGSAEMGRILEFGTGARRNGREMIGGVA